MLVQNYGAWVYAILFLIVFCETGLVVTPFLPGDSLLFVAGTIAGAGAMNVHAAGAAADCWRPCWAIRSTTRSDAGSGRAYSASRIPGSSSRRTSSAPIATSSSYGGTHHRHRALRADRADLRAVRRRHRRRWTTGASRCSTWPVRVLWVALIDLRRLLLRQLAAGARTTSRWSFSASSCCRSRRRSSRSRGTSSSAQGSAR